MAEKTKYKILFRDDHGDLMRIEYASAFSREQARVLVYRRAVREGWDYLFRSDSVLIVVSEDTEGMAKLKLKRQLDKERACPECGYEVEYDYCQHCGWQKFSGWYGRHISKSAASKQ